MAKDIIKASQSALDARFCMLSGSAGATPCPADQALAHTPARVCRLAQITCFADACFVTAMLILPEAMADAPDHPYSSATSVRDLR
jgi:hypothetical protein